MGEERFGDAGSFLCVLTLLSSHSTQGSSSLGSPQHAGHRPCTARHFLLYAAASGCHRGRAASQGQGSIPHPNLSEDAAMRTQLLEAFSCQGLDRRPHAELVAPTSLAVRELLTSLQPLIPTGL